jgi:hypothetical protein
MAWRHRDILEGELHEPKGFTLANNGDDIWRNEVGASEWTDREVLPASLDFVDGSVAPPTTSSGDIYVLSSGGSVHVDWGSVALNDWVRYDGAIWNVITPSKSILCYDKALDVLMSYSGSVWSAVGSDTNLENTDLTQSNTQRRYTIDDGLPNTKLTFGGSGGEFQLQDAIDFKMFNGVNDVANERLKLFVGSNQSYMFFNNSRTSITTVSDDLTLTGQATNASFTSKLQMGADIDLQPASSRSILFKSDNIFFKNRAGNIIYGRIDDDVFIWGSNTSVGSEKFSVQVDSVFKGSDDSSSTTGFDVVNDSETSLLDIRNNGDIYTEGLQGLNVTLDPTAITSMTFTNGILTAQS